MIAAELRELAQKLCAVEPHDYEDRAVTEAAAELIELVAFAEGGGIRVARGPLCWITKIGDAYISAPTLIDTLRRAKEASRGRA